MPSPNFLRLFSTSGLLVLSSLSQISAHTWTDQLNLIAPNGTFYGAPGYPRGFTPRDAALDPRGDANVHELPPDGRPSGNAILPSDPICKDQQSIGNYSSKYPRLSAFPGANVAIRYQENGHVTQPWLVPGKGVGSGVVYVYGTTEPKADDKYLDIHRVWTPTSSPGRLLATRYFDDGQCFLANDNGSPISIDRAKQAAKAEDPLMGPNLWCQTDVPLPTDITGSNYTLYWVWDWPVVDQSGNVKVNQSYTSCIDLEIGSAPNISSSSSKADFIRGQDLNFAAISTQLASPFNFNPAPTAKQSMYVSGVASTPVYTYTPTTASASSGSAASTTSSNILVAMTSSISRISSSRQSGSNYTTAVPSASAPASSDPLQYTAVSPTLGSVSPFTQGESNSTSTISVGASSIQSSGIITVTVSAPVAATTVYVTVQQTSAILSASANVTHTLRGRTFTR